MSIQGEKTAAWSKYNCERAAEIWQLHYADLHGDDDSAKLHGERSKTMRRIAASISRSFFSVDYRYRTYGPGFGIDRTRGASANALADRDARAEAKRQRSLTAETFGDPPPGFSALDRRRSCGGGSGSGSGTVSSTGPRR